MVDRKENIVLCRETLLTDLIDRVVVSIKLVRRVGFGPYTLKNGEVGEMIRGTGFVRAYRDLNKMYGPVWVTGGKGKEDLVTGLQSEKEMRKELND
ncbi:MAG: hypothetical protein WCT01_00965 [Candidatus Shapirobacteria bacterium]|jgi:hypothetical protein